MWGESLRAGWSVIYRTFGKGLFAILPIAVTLYALYWLGAIFERAIGGVLQLFLPLTINEQVYLPYIQGMGLVLGVVLVFLAGVALNTWFTQWLYDWFEALIDRIPLVKSIYGSVRDLLGFFASAGNRSEQVVVIEFGEGSHRMQLLGFVTRQDCHNLPDGLGGDDRIAVYLPMSYQIGGYTIMVPRDSVTPISMNTEQALRFAVTAGMSTERAGESGANGQRSQTPAEPPAS
jgi:uncharacterized membrane protein